MFSYLAAYAGYESAMESWQWLYLLIILIAGISLTIPIMRNLPERIVRIPRGVLLLPTIAILFWFTPYGLIFIYFLNICLLISPAPTGASIIAGLFCIGCWYLTISSLFPVRS